MVYPPVMPFAVKVFWYCLHLWLKEVKSTWKGPDYSIRKLQHSVEFLEKENYIQIEESEYCFDNNKIKNPSI